jgi:hypothetical protein
MIGATTSRASAARRSSRLRCIHALAGFGLVALAMTACGGAAVTSSPTAASSSSPAPAGTRAPAGAPVAFPGVSGTAAAVSGSSMEVQNPTDGQVTVTFTKATAITDVVAATSHDVTVGSCVTVTGQAPASGSSAPASGPARSVTAATVTVSTPVNGDCGAAGGFGGPGGIARPRGTFPPNPGSGPTLRPGGGRGGFGVGAFGGANGKVSSLSASGFVLQGRRPVAPADPGASGSPSAGAQVSITVTTTATTKYLKVVTAGPAALKVGECITAIGQANSIGAVAARAIRISQPGPNGCATRFGGGRTGSGGNQSGVVGNA